MAVKLTDCISLVVVDSNKVYCCLVCECIVKIMTQELSLSVTTGFGDCAQIHVIGCQHDPGWLAGQLVYARMSSVSCCIYLLS